MVLLSKMRKVGNCFGAKIQIFSENQFVNFGAKNGSKLGQKWIKIGPKMDQNWAKNGPKLSKWFKIVWRENSNIFRK